jgi:hypothetical protein
LYDETKSNIINNISTLQKLDHLKKLMKYFLRGGDVKISIAGIKLNMESLKMTAISRPFSDFVAKPIRRLIPMYQQLASLEPISPILNSKCLTACGIDFQI